MARILPQLMVALHGYFNFTGLSKCLKCLINPSKPAIQSTSICSLDDIFLISPHKFSSWAALAVSSAPERFALDTLSS